MTLFPGLAYPLMRLALIAVGLAVAFGLWLLVNHTRFGMLMRAGADDRQMVDALGVNMRVLYMSVFGLGAILCGLAGVMAAPLLAVEIAMGERILITTFVVIVIGGVGSIRGAFVGACWWAWSTVSAGPTCRRYLPRYCPIRWPTHWRPASSPRASMC